MKHIEKQFYDLRTKLKENSGLHIIILYVLVFINFYL